MAKIHDDNYTFWKLISTDIIEIPEYQRDYAQGRNDEDTNQIRESLVRGMYEALMDSEKHMVLNFVYGESSKSEDSQRQKFIPVDGQQRLTTLFLLHFYIFSRAGYTDGIKRIRTFSYKIRLTSNRFCNNICGNESNNYICYIDYDKETISDQIEEKSWFTGNFVGDPTVRSMLHMLDHIHKVFSEEQHNYLALSERLINDCPITFLWQPLERVQEISDLYIKMNSRGKALSDFEIFKSKLQGTNKTLKNGKDGLLKAILGSNNSPQNEVSFICKYNNDFSDMFFHFYKVEDENSKIHVGKSLYEFDMAMMNYVKSVVNDYYFIFLSNDGVDQKGYRDFYQVEVAELNGNRFFSFLENGYFVFRNGEKPFENRGEKAVDEGVFVNAIRKANDILQQMYNYYIIYKSLKYIDNTVTSQNAQNQVVGQYPEYYDEENIFCSDPFETKLKPSAVRFGLLGFIGIFGYPEKGNVNQMDAFYLWKHFVHNMSENVTWKSPVNVVEFISFINDILSTLKTNSTAYKYYDLLKELSNYPLSQKEFLAQQQSEEKKKYELFLNGNMTGSSVEWTEAILKAEQYYHDGQIGFLLFFSLNDQDEYDLALFKKIFEKSKLLLDTDKKVFDKDLANIA